MSEYKDAEDGSTIGCWRMPTHVTFQTSCDAKTLLVCLSFPDAIAFAHDVLAAAGHVMPVLSSTDDAPAFDVGAVAWEIAAEWWAKGISTGSPASNAERRKDIKDCAARVLARHVPEAAPRVVTVTYSDLDAAYQAGDRKAQRDILNARLTARAGATTNSASADSSLVVDALEMAERFADDMLDTKANGTREFARQWFAEHWNAGAALPQFAKGENSAITEIGNPDTIPVRVVRRPVERPSAFLAAPSAGLYLKRSQDGEISGPVRLPEGCIVGRSAAAICRVDTDAPTWIERTTVQTARAWTEEDIGDGAIVAWFPSGAVETYPSGHRDDAVVWLNKHNAHAIAVLPEVSP
jgi:hypothetical protein